jgi:hypothetical protein
MYHLAREIKVQSTKNKALLPASLVQQVQDTALPALRHRFESGTMLQIPSAPVAQLEERDASNVEVAGSNPARSSNSNFGLRISNCGFKNFT